MTTLTEPPPSDSEIRDLYRGPLAEFTSSRQALAKRRRQAGDPDHGSIGKLRKPSLSAWAVNRLFADEPEAMAALIDAGERARAAQRQAAEGGGDADQLRELLRTIQSETERLSGRGVEILTENGRAPGDAIVKRLDTDLQALALDPAAAEVAARGWLDTDLEPPAFEVLAALTVAAAPARPSPRPKPESPEAAPAPPEQKTDGEAPPKATVHRIDEARQAAAERKKKKAREAAAERERKKAQQRRERIEKAEAALAGAQSEAEAAEREAKAAEREADRAQAEAAEAERLAEAAREAAHTARRSAEKARKRAAAAEAAVAHARRVAEKAKRS